MKISSINSYNNYHNSYKNLKKKHIKVENNGQFLQNNQINCQPLKPR